MTAAEAKEFKARIKDQNNSNQTIRDYNKGIRDAAARKAQNGTPPQPPADTPNPNRPGLSLRGIINNIPGAVPGTIPSLPGIPVAPPVTTRVGVPAVSGTSCTLSVILITIPGGLLNIIIDCVDPAIHERESRMRNGI